MATRRQVLSAILATAGAAMAAPAKPDFSGRWKIVPNSSSKEAPAELGEIIDQRESTIRIDSQWNHNTSTGVGNAAILAPAVLLRSDGTVTSNEMPMGMSLSTKSHWDGDKLVTDWQLSGLSAPLNGTWTRYLTGPNTMIVDSRAESSGRRMSMRYVFAK